MLMPPPDQAIIAKRAAIAAALERIVAAPDGVVVARGRAPRLRDRRADRLSAIAAARRAALDHGGGLRGAEILPGRGRQGGAARRRHLALGRRAAAGRRHHPRHGQVQPHPRDRLRQSLRRGAAGRHQSRHHQRGAGRRLLLRARPVEPDRLHHRRQCRREFGRRALPQIRPHHQQRAGHRDGADEWRGGAPGRQASRCRGLRSPGPDDRLGRAARRRHRGDGAHLAQARDGARVADRLSLERERRRLRRRDHRRRHHPGRHGDDGQAGDPRGRGFRPCRLSAAMSRRCSSSSSMARRPRSII